MSKTRASSDSQQKETRHSSSVRRKLIYSPNDNALPSSSKLTKTKKRPKRKLSDRNYKKGDENKGPKRTKEGNENSHSGIINMRGDNRKYLTEEENSEPVITSFICYPDQFNTKLNLQVIGETIQNVLKTVDCYKEVVEVLATNKNGSPIKIKVEDNTILNQTKSYGLIRVFTNMKLGEPEPIKTIPNNSSFFESENYKAVIPPPKSIMDINKIITREIFFKTAKETYDNGGQRSISQNKVVTVPGYKPEDASATKYLKAAQTAGVLIPGTTYEHSHDEPYSMSGKAVQTAASGLAVSTAASNTEQLFVELDLKQISKFYPKGFTYQAKTEFIPKTRFGIKRDLKITTDDYQLPITFNLQEVNTPHTSYYKVFHAIIKGLNKSVEKQVSNKENNSTSNENINNNTDQSNMNTSHKISSFKFFFHKTKTQQLLPAQVAESSLKKSN